MIAAAGHTFGNHKRYRTAAVKRREKIDLLKEIRSASNRELARLVIEEDRIDILCELVGYNFHGFQEVISLFQMENLRTLQLGPRGWGKSLIGTGLKIAHEVIKNRDIRCLIGSSTSDRAKDMLTFVKGVLENDRVVEIFGAFQSEKKWAETSIVVRGRTKLLKEPTVSIAGTGTAIASGHFDLIIADDLVTEGNASTQVQRDKVRQWFGTTLIPCVTDENTQFHVLGTRYHPDDLYQHLIDNPMFAVQVIPALNLDGETNYPERFSSEYLQGMKLAMGTSAWESQMMQDPSSLQGSVFLPAFFRYVAKCPTEHFYTYTGVDLAIGTEAQHDKFAWCTVGICATERNKVYVLDYFTSRLSLAEQDEEIYRNWSNFHPLITGIESNHFQAAKTQRLRTHPKYKVINAVPIQTHKDKMTRAQLLSVRFERGEIVFLESLKGSDLEQQLLGFPNHRFRDLFDALDMAVRMVYYRRGRKRQRKREPGLIRAPSIFRR